MSNSLLILDTPTVNSELHSTNLVHAGFVSEAIGVHAADPIGTIAGSVTSAPGGSIASWSGASFTPDVAGDYVLSATNGTSSATSWTLRVFPAAALTAKVIADPCWDTGPSSPSTNPLRTDALRRAIVRNIAKGVYGAVSSATMAALTTNAPIPSGLSGLPRGV